MALSMGMGQILGVSQEIRMTQRQRIKLGFAFACTLCKQSIANEGARAKFEDQMAQLEISRRGLYSPCLECGQNVKWEGDKPYQRRVHSRIRILERAQRAGKKRVQKAVQTRTWDNPKSLLGEFWSGPCPIDGVEMAANKQDNWECPKCRLQIIAMHPGPFVLKEKGLGQFRTKPDGLMIFAVDELPGVGDFKIIADHRV